MAYNARFVVGVWFDGTLANTDPDGAILCPMPCARAALKRLRGLEGVDLVLTTDRYGDALDEALKWCVEQGLEFAGINYAAGDVDVFIDHRAIGVPVTLTKETFQTVPDWKMIATEVSARWVEEYADLYLNDE